MVIPLVDVTIILHLYKYVIVMLHIWNKYANYGYKKKKDLVSGEGKPVL